MKQTIDSLMKWLQKQLQDTYKISFDDSFIRKVRIYYNRRSKFPGRRTVIGEYDIRSVLDFARSRELYARYKGYNDRDAIRERILDEIWEISQWAVRIARRKHVKVIKSNLFKEALKGWMEPRFAYGGTIDKPPDRPRTPSSSET